MYLNDNLNAGMGFQDTSHIIPHTLRGTFYPREFTKSIQKVPLYILLLESTPYILHTSWVSVLPLSPSNQTSNPNSHNRIASKNSFLHQKMYYKFMAYLAEHLTCIYSPTLYFTTIKALDHCYFLISFLSINVTMPLSIIITNSTLKFYMKQCVCKILIFGTDEFEN